MKDNIKDAIEALVQSGNVHSNPGYKTMWYDRADAVHRLSLNYNEAMELLKWAMDNNVTIHAGNPTEVIMEDITGEEVLFTARNVLDALIKLKAEMGKNENKQEH